MRDRLQRPVPCQGIGKRVTNTAYVTQRQDAPRTAVELAPTVSTTEREAAGRNVVVANGVGPDLVFVDPAGGLGTGVLIAVGRHAPHITVGNAVRPMGEDFGEAVAQRTGLPHRGVSRRTGAVTGSWCPSQDVRVGVPPIVAEAVALTLLGICAGEYERPVICSEICFIQNLVSGSQHDGIAGLLAAGTVLVTALVVLRRCAARRTT